MIRIELHSLEVHGRHGVLDVEEKQGQPFLFDIELDVSDAALSDRIEDAVDYRDVVARVQAVSNGRRYSLLEALAAAVADALLESFPVERVRVRARKRPADLPVAEATAVVERP